MRYDQREVSYSFGGPLTTAVKWLIASLVLVWILIQPVAVQGVVDRLVLHPHQVVRGAVWQLATYAFLSDGLWGLLWGCLGLFMFGCELERVWGWRKFLFYFMLTSIAAGVGVTLVSLVRHVPMALMGPWSALMSIAVAWALLFPYRQAGFFPLPIVIPARWFAAIWVAIDMLSLWTAYRDVVVPFSVLVGPVVGYVYLEKLRGMPRVRGAYTRWRNQRIARKFRVVVNENFLDPRNSDDDRRTYFN